MHDLHAKEDVGVSGEAYLKHSSSIADGPLSFSAQVKQRSKGPQTKLPNKDKAPQRPENPKSAAMGNHVALSLPSNLGTDPSIRKEQAAKELKIIKKLRDNLNGTHSQNLQIKAADAQAPDVSLHRDPMHVEIDNVYTEGMVEEPKPPDPDTLHPSMDTHSKLIEIGTKTVHPFIGMELADVTTDEA